MRGNNHAVKAYLSRYKAILWAAAELRREIKTLGSMDKSSIHYGHVGDLSRIDDALTALLSDIESTKQAHGVGRAMCYEPGDATFGD